MAGTESIKHSFDDLVLAFAIGGAFIVGWENQGEITDFIFGVEGSPEAHVAAVGNTTPNT